MSQFTIQKISVEDSKLSSAKFWDKMYNVYLKPRPVCSFCDKEIDNPKDWFSFTCSCPKYYHKPCFYQRLGDLLCPDCNECKDIYTFVRFPSKFLDRDRYLEIYQRSVTGLNPQVQLKIYNLWFHAHDVFIPPLLDLYTYLEPHSPQKTLDFIHENLANYLIESYDPAIIVKHNGDSIDIEYDIEQIDYMDQKVFVDIDSFRQKFKEFSYDLVGDDFPWSDSVLLVGGTVHKCLDTRVKIEDVPEYCDIDIFIVNQDLKIVTKEVKKVIKYFQNRLGENIYWLVRRNVINLYVPGYNRSVQIIMFRNTIESVLHKFDFSHIQYAYNGKQILTTLPGLKYASLLISIHSGFYDVTFPKRYYKAKQMKLCVALPMAQVLFLSIPKVANLDYWYPTYTDDLDRIQQQLKNIYRVNKKYITKSKPFKIFYKRIPVEFNNDRLAANGPTFTSDGEVASYMDREVLFPSYA